MSRTLLAIEVVSVDGVMQAPGRSDEDPRGGFTGGGWAATAFADDPDAARRQQESMADVDGPTVMLFGRRSYLDLLHQWLEVAGDNPFAASFRAQQKYVVSNTLTEPLPYENSVLLTGDGVEQVRALKADGDGTIVILGSGDLVRRLAAADLIDEYLLNQVPVVLGHGQRLFDGTEIRLGLRSHAVSSRGITLTRFRVRRTDPAAVGRPRPDADASAPPISTHHHGTTSHPGKDRQMTDIARPEHDRRVIAWVTGVTLDGCTSGPTGPANDTWLHAHATDPSTVELFEGVWRGADTIVLGRSNYEGFFGFWPAVARDEHAAPCDRAVGQWLDRTEKVVASTTLDTVEWENAVLTSNLEDTVRELRQRDGGDIIVLNSATVIRSLLHADLVDELRFMLVPVIVGGGLRLLPDGLAASSWTLRSSHTLASGAVALQYHRTR